MKNKKGFTLIELLVVIAIIGLLSTLAVVSLNGARSKARDARRTADLKAMQSAIELYKGDDSSGAIFATPAAAPGTAWKSVGVGGALASYLPGGMPTDPGSNMYTLCTNPTAGSMNYLIVGTTENAGTTGSVGLISGWGLTNCINTSDLKTVPVGTCGSANLFCLGDISM